MILVNAIKYGDDWYIGDEAERLSNHSSAFIPVVQALIHLEQKDLVEGRLLLAPHVKVMDTSVGVSLLEWNIPIPPNVEISSLIDLDDKKEIIHEQYIADTFRDIVNNFDQDTRKR